ncbi:hypothetical protein ABB27_06210 [Stenotrophomonas terrae]|uniref:Filamentous haemagglutinin FhaB/tRNA nuclease CdiA-like TPS domain-containing protein n=1 Tax=Stenotrophomonas terrae TaxID=405446 RepID=A0A0R0CUX8_9GAMM|nr:MBG domain-containing protein [Stenotrophomonas terrae]KRG69444.1 hypothetical protein ABB27_06210 [Stenotrophomonas terrae]
MNRIYRLVFNHALGQVQVTSEIGTSPSGTTGATRRLPARLRLLPLALALAYAAGAQAVELPQNGIATGATISSAGNTMTITQAQAKALITWGSFNIGEGGAVNITTPDANGVTLNMVNGGTLSSIDGVLKSNGHVFLINPAGIAFGGTAQVNVAGLVASSLTSNTDGQSDDYQFAQDGAAAVVSTAAGAQITSLGPVMLMGASVSNSGSIVGSTVNLLSAGGVTLHYDPLAGLTAQLEAATSSLPAATSAAVSNTGSITANQIILRANLDPALAASAINLGGAVQATQLLSADVVGGGLNISGDVAAGTIRLAGDKGVNQSDGKVVASTGLELAVTGDARLSREANKVSSIGGTVSGNLALSNAADLTQTGALEVTGSTTLTSALNNVTLTNVGNSFGGNVSLSADQVNISASGRLAFGNVGVSSLAVTAGSIHLPAEISSAGAQVYNGAVVLDQSASLSSTLGAITFNGVIDGAHALWATAGGEVSFGGAVGGSTALASLDVSGGARISLPSSVITTGTQRYNGKVALLGTTWLTSRGAGAIDFRSTINGAHDLTVSTAGATTFAGAVGGTEALASLTTDAAGTTELGGNVQTTGSQTYRDSVSLSGPATLSSAAAGDITFASSVTGLSALTVNTAGQTAFGGTVSLAALETDAGGTTKLGGNVTTSGAQAYRDGLVLAGDVTLTSLGGYFININAGANGAHALVVDTAGTTTLAGGIGSTAALTSLATRGGGATRLSGVLKTLGNQDYGENAVLSASTALTSLGGSIAFSGTLDGPYALATEASGGTRFLGAVGAANALASLAVSAGSFSAQGITTSGDLSLGVFNGIEQTGAYNVGGNASFASNGDLTLTNAGNLFNGNVSLDGATVSINASTALDISRVQVTKLDARASGALALDDASIAGGGAALIGKAMSLGSITVTDGGALEVLGTSISQFGALDVSGTSVFNAVNGNIALDALNVFGGRVDMLGGDVLINAGGLLRLGSVSARNLEAKAAQLQFGSNITTAGYQRYVGALGLTRDTSLDAGGALNITGNIDGGWGLTLISDDAVRIAGGIGQSTALSSLTVSGPAAIDSAVTTVGAQAFNGALQLNGDSSLTSVQGDITLAGVDGAHALALNAGSGMVRFGSIGASNVLTSLQVDSATADLLGTSVTTSGAQQYNASMKLTKDAALTSTGGGDIGFGSTLDGDFALQVNTAGVTRFGGAVGGSKALASLTTDAAGTTELGGGVATSGNLAFNDAVNLKAFTSVRSQSGTTTFGSTVVGPWDLVATGSAGSAFGGAVDVRSLQVQGGGTTTLGGDVSVDTSAMFSRPVSLTNDVTLDVGTVSFAGAINGAHALDITATGAVIIGDHVGAITALDSLTVRAASLNANGITTTGNLSVDVAAAIRQAAAYSIGGAASFASQGDITLTNGGNRFAGVVSLDGGTVQIASAAALDLDVVQAGSLSATAAGGLRLGNATIAGDSLLSGNGIVFDDATIQGKLGAVSSGSIQQSGALNVAGTSQLSAVGDITLDNGQNAFDGVVSLHAKNATIASARTLSLGTSDAGDLKASAAGDLRLTGQITANNVDLATDGIFENRHGANAIQLSGNGHWRIYLKSPTSAHAFGNLDSANSAIWNTAAFAGTTASGNRYLFAWQPTLTIQASALRKIYGDTLRLDNAYTVSGGMAGVAGAYNADVIADLIRGTPVLSSSGAAGTAVVSGSPYQIDINQGSLNTGISGYALTFVGGQLSIDPRTLTITANSAGKTYGQIGNFNGFSSDALINGDSLSSVDLASSGIGATANVGNYAISASNAVGTGLSNYDIHYVDGSLSIGKAGLVITANDASRRAGELLTLDGYRASGLLNGDSIDSVSLSSAGNNANAGPGMYAILVGDAQGARLGNYDISYQDGSLQVTGLSTTIAAEIARAVVASRNDAAPVSLPNNLPPLLPAPSSSGTSILLPEDSCTQARGMGCLTLQPE